MNNQGQGIFHAGTNYEPLSNGQTRIRVYVDGGQLLSEEVVTTEEALRRMEAAIKHDHQEEKGNLR